MQHICDFHVHSRFARGCGKDISIPLLEKWARVKGVDVLGTGDCVHPEWLRELKAELIDEREGIYYTKTGQPFILQTELSLIYTEGRGRRVHLVVLAPSFAVVDMMVAYLRQFGRTESDGRPIFSIPAWRLVRDLRMISDQIEIIPAHAWTPWFSVFGSKSGFDSLTECFHEQVEHIHAIETGLSSDIEMNERLSQLDGVRFVSFSDAHSYWPWRLGREATILDLEHLTYANILAAIRTGKGFHGTIEVPPEYGKYHIDGHRACGVVQEPEQTRQKGELCPVCKHPLTIGVLYRVDELADRPARGGNHVQKFHKLLPLHEIISLVTGKGLATKGTWEEYWRILKAGKHEFDVLLNATQEQLLAVTTPQIAKAIIMVREGDVQFTPGYDGVYGIPKFEGIETKGTVGDSEEEHPASPAQQRIPKKSQPAQQPRPKKEQPQLDLSKFIA